MTLAATLDRALRAVAPIAGVSIGRDDDKSTWRIDYADTATAAQKAAAEAVLAAFDPAAEEAPLRLSKLAIVDRLSDAELDTFLALRSGTAETVLPLGPAQQIRLALRWDNANEIDPLAADVRDAFTAVFGPTRMAALLGG